MKVVRHGKPSNAYLRTLRKPKKNDYDKLVKAAIEAIVNGEVDVIVAFPYTFKFPKDFPTGVKTKGEGVANFHRIKARKLLTWLREHGHTEVTVKDIRYQRSAFTQFVRRVENSINNLLECVDIHQEDDYDDIHQHTDEEEE